MHIVVTRRELANCLPPAGRYRVRIQAVMPIPADGPEEIELRMQVVPPPPLPTVLRDRFRIRGAPPGGVDEMRRLLHLFHLAGVHVAADTRLDLDALLGLDLLADVRREPGPSGFPYAAVVGYAKPWIPSSHAAPATLRRTPPALGAATPHQ